MLTLVYNLFKISEIFDFPKKFLKMIWTLEFLHHISHAIVLYNIIQKFFILISIINGKCNTLLAESTCSTNSVEICFWITAGLAIYSLLRHIVVDNELYFWNIDTSGNQVGGDQYINFLVSKFLNGLISFLLGHV